MSARGGPLPVPRPDYEPDLYETANLSPRDTGLPMTVWVSPRGHARHDARVKVCRVHGDRMIADDTAVMSIRSEPRLVHGDLPPEDERAVARWIAANAEALIGYWDGQLSTLEFASRLQRV